MRSVCVNSLELLLYPSIITDADVLSSKGVEERVCRLVDELKMLSNKRVAFLATRELKTILLLIALLKVKATACPLDIRLPPLEIQRAVQELDAYLISSPLPCHAPSSDDIATLLFTSGTTSAKKIVAHSLSNHAYSALGMIQALELKTSDRWLLSLPLSHVSGLAIVFRALFSGAALVLSTLPIEEAILRHKVSLLSLVPTQLYRLMQTERGQKALQSLRALIIGGAPIPPSLLERCKELNIPCLTSYGMTEMSSTVLLNGSILPHRALTLAKDGEILVRGPVLFQGYWKKGKALELPSLQFENTSWFATRDLGTWISKTTVQCTGRKDLLFISGGENIQPEEIESALMALPEVEQALVVPIPDEELGQIAVAFVQTASGQLSIDFLKGGLKESLPSFKVPKLFFPFPRSDERLKIDRREFIRHAQALVKNR